MQSWQLRENLMLQRTSLVGLQHIATLVSALNSTIVFLFSRRFQQSITYLCSRFMWVGAYHYQSPLAKLHYLPQNSQATLTHHPHATLPKNSPQNSQLTKVWLAMAQRIMSVQGAIVGATIGIGWSFGG
jgi:hypothetical protein